jgi:hypothetical protein
MDQAASLVSAMRRGNTRKQVDAMQQRCRINTKHTRRHDSFEALNRCAKNNVTFFTYPGARNR